jgi:hypothetical protein
MNTQQTIKAIVDAAVNDDYAAAEKALDKYVLSDREMFFGFISTYIYGVTDDGKQAFINTVMPNYDTVTELYNDFLIHLKIKQ